jgi:hypothetical protein
VQPRAVILVEGITDRAVLEALAVRLGRDLAAERVEVIAMGGAHAIGRFLDRYGPRGLDVRLAGLYDVGEADVFRRALGRAGLGSDLEGVGFYACDADLEDELVRAVGAARIEELLEAHGDIRPFRTKQKQLEWRDRTVEAQLRSFFRYSGRTRPYASALVEALDDDRVPRPLARVLDAVQRR